MGAGRPSKYDTHVKPRLVEIEQWARDGLFEYQIAKNLGVNHESWSNYKKEYVELVDALKNGFTADAIVENTAFQMAKSGKFPVMTMWWLQNRQSNKWTNKQKIEVDTKDTEVLTDYTKAIKDARTKADKDDLNGIIEEAD